MVWQTDKIYPQAHKKTIVRKDGLVANVRPSQGLDQLIKVFTQAITEHLTVMSYACGLFLRLSVRTTFLKTIRYMPGTQ